MAPKQRPSATDFYVPENILDSAEDILSPTTGKISDDNLPTTGDDPIQTTGDALLGGYINTILGTIPGANLIAPAVTNYIGGQRTQGKGVSLLDPFGMTGARDERISELAQEEGIGEKFNSDTGRYSHLGGLVDRYVHGITDDEVTSRVVRDNHSRIKGSKEYQYLKDEKGREYVDQNYGPLVSGTKVSKDGKTLAKTNKLITEIEGIENGKKLLDAARAEGKTLSVGELEAIKAKADRLKPLTETEQANLDGTKQQTQASKDRTRIAEETLTQRGKEHSDSNSLALAKLELADRTAQYNVDVANIKIRNQAAQAEADRELRKDLALLTRGDRKDEREYRRERDERKDRQLMILQLMNGLKQMGQSFAL